MRVYIAGPISGDLPGVSLDEKLARFRRAEAHFNAESIECVVPMDLGNEFCPGDCNPHGHVGQDGVATHSWECFMRHDIRALLECDTIALLPGFALSRGARLEVKIAESLGMTVIWLNDTGVPINPP